MIDAKTVICYNCEGTPNCNDPFDSNRNTTTVPTKNCTDGCKVKHNVLFN